MGAVLAIARIICAYPASGFAAFWHHLRHYFFPTKSLKSPDERQNEEITRKHEEGISNEEVRSSIRGTCIPEGMTYNSGSFDTLGWRKPILDNVMEALADPNIHIIGVCGSNYEIKDGLLSKVRRRIDRDSLFDVVLTATISKKKPNMKSIQEEIAGQFGFHFTEKSEDKRTIELVDRIKNEAKVLVILCNLRKGIDLGKVGIPFGADHTGCKLLLASESEELLSNQMHTQKIFVL